MTHREIPRLRRAVAHTGPVSRSWQRGLDSLGVLGAFNPSVLTVPGARLLAFRGPGPSGGRPFHAYLASAETGSHRWSLIDLTTAVAAHGPSPIADPKLVRLGEVACITYNTGFGNGTNEIGLVRVWPDLGRPQRVTTPGRRPVEKNWGFLPSTSGLSVVYGLDPFVRLDLVDGEPGADGELVVARGDRPDRDLSPPRLTLGPQPLLDGPDLLAIAHERVHWRGRRGYLGRAVRVRDALGPNPTVQCSPVRLVHDLRHLWLRGARHNPHLLFATYASGLDISGRTAVLGYGVNDRFGAFGQFPLETLWP